MKRVLIFTFVYIFSGDNDVLEVDDSLPMKHHTILNKELTEKNFVEADQRLNLLTTEENSADWEETVKRDGWTPLQHRIFNKVKL